MTGRIQSCVLWSVEREWQRQKKDIGFLRDKSPPTARSMPTAREGFRHLSL
jgi:hypothetical protein